jgi:hypothetical protein
MSGENNLIRTILYERVNPLRKNKLKKKEHMNYERERKSQCCNQTKLQVLGPVSQFKHAKNINVHGSHATLTRIHQQIYFYTYNAHFKTKEKAQQ